MRIRVGLVGTGVIAQVMHLHYLTELADRFEVAAVCDLDGESARACAGRYGAIPTVLVLPVPVGMVTISITSER